MQGSVDAGTVSEMVTSPHPQAGKGDWKPTFTPAGYRGLLLRLFISILLVALTTAVCRHVFPVNATTAGFAYLISVLIVATAWGLIEATLASVVAVLCLNYFFLPPVGTFTVADPQNWVALIAFLATSITASQLSARAKRRTREALDRQTELERLYALSRAVLLSDMRQPLAKQIAHFIAQTFDLPAVLLYDRTTGDVHRAGPEEMPAVDDKLKEAATQGTQFHDAATQTTISSVRLGGEPIGSIAIRGTLLSDTALQALANLVAIGLERVRSQEAANRAEAARQSQELKSTLLDAIAHEFKTPLTSIKAASTALLATPPPASADERELLTIVDEETDRLSRLVTEAIQMARIEGSNLQVECELLSLELLISGVLQQMKPLVDGHNVVLDLASGLAPIMADRELMQLALRQVIGNAIKYSPPDGKVKITAYAVEKGITIVVQDEGCGIPEAEQAKIFERFYRSPRDRNRVTGTGMGLTIAREVLRAHGGDISVRSVPGKGSEFFFVLPQTGEKTK